MTILTPAVQAWRSLKRTPAFTITAVLTLLIGVAATVAIFTVVNGVLLRPLPYGNPERLVMARHDLPGVSLHDANQTSATYFTYKKLARSIDGIAVYQETAVNVSEPGGASEPQRIPSAAVSASLIPVLQVSPLLGRNFTDVEDLPNGPPVVIIGHALWRNRFGGDPRVVGRTLEVNGVSREIVGVMREDFRFPLSATQLWTPIALDPNDPFPGGFNYDAVARLKDGMSVAAAEQDFRTVLPRIVELSPNLAPGVPTKLLLDQAKPNPMLRPLREDITGNIAQTLWMLAAAAGLVLLVACFNVANLVLVRADGRQRELAVREALGAGRARVLAHFLAESGVLAAIAAVLGVVVAYFAVRALVVGGPAEIPRLAEVSIDASSVVFALVIAAVAAAVCSVIPALRIGRGQLSKALREGGRSGTAGRTQHRVRGALVASQIALALVVLASSGVLLRSFQRLNAVQPGFNPENVLTIWMSPPRVRYADHAALGRFYGQLTARVAELPGVDHAGVTSRIPLLFRGMNQNPFYAEGDESSASRIPPLHAFTAVDGGYFRAMGIPMLAGRAFDRLERQRAGEAVISRRTAIHFWRDSTGQAALGKRFRGLPSGPWYTIIGVADDVRDTALAAPPALTVYFPQGVDTDENFTQTQRTMALVIRTSSDPASMTTAVQRVVRELDPSLPIFDVRPMTAVVRQSIARLSFIILMLASAAITTLLLGAIGLYGVMAYLVTLRTRELGVRIALGAQPASVAVMMTRHGLALTAFGIGGGLLLFAGIARFLGTFVYGVAPSDPGTLVAASLLLAVIAATASWIPARRASRVDPAEALRSD